MKTPHLLTALVTALLTAHPAAPILAAPTPTMPTPSTTPAPTLLDPWAAPTSTAALRAALDRLNVVGTVLYVAAHPDDENTRLLAYLAGERGFRVAYLSLTRGDGGQNLIGPELGPALGLIRTHELLAARRSDGAEQRFTRAVDFGYSKSATETLTKWGKSAVLADVTRVIADLRPDLIITRFSPTPPNHGHHMASALLAREAFTAAQRTSSPSTPLRLYENKSPWRFQPNQDLSSYLRVDLGRLDPASGLTYPEIAARSRTMHKSQGFGAAPDYGPQFEYFELTASRAGLAPPPADPFDEIPATWARFPNTQAVQKTIDAARAAFDPHHPEQLTPKLLDIRAALTTLLADPASPVYPYALHKRSELDRLILNINAVRIFARTASPTLTPGATFPVVVTIDSRRARLTLDSIRWPIGTAAASRDQGTVAPPSPGTFIITQTNLTLPQQTPYSTPSWLKRHPHHDLFDLPDALATLPTAPPDLTVTLALRFTDAPTSPAIPFALPLTFAWTDRVEGQRIRLTEVLPPLTVTPTTDVAMAPNGAPVTLQAAVTAHGAARDRSVSLQVPPGWQVTPASVGVSLTKDGAEVPVSFTVTPPPYASEPATLTFTLDGEPAHALQRIDYPHIPVTTVLSPSTVRLVPLALTRTAPPAARSGIRPRAPKIGYLAGAGDAIPQSLSALGFEVTPLDPAALDTADLSPFLAIVAGIRAYNVNPALEHHHDALMRYIADGGTYLVQYLTSSRFSPLPDLAIGPYPFTIDQGRVTDEGAALTPLDPKHPALTSPNLLTQDDFSSWVQERGLYFASTWAPTFTPLFSSHDPDEPPLEGSVLVARLGKGAFVYTGLSFFRQLPAGVPGAHRLFVNLLNLANTLPVLQKTK